MLDYRSNPKERGKNLGDDLAEVGVLHHHRALHDRPDAEDRDLRLVDDRRVEQGAAAARVGQRERPACQLVGRDLAGPGPGGQVADLAGQHPRQLSGGQAQRVALARALVHEPRNVILDEPTAALGVAQTRQVLELVKRLAEQGLAVVLISHNLHDVFEVATRITVLRLGRDVGVYEREKTTQQEVVQAITAGIPTKVAGIPATAPELAS